MRKQTGFTLVEIAIVLVIIGLLLGGVLKGQELVSNAQAKSIGNDLKNIQTMIYGYQDRFRALPGDDALVATHLNGGTAAPAGVNRGNGQITGAWNAAGITTEPYLFWQHVRLAGFAAGSTTVGAADYLPTNSQGGAIGVGSTSPITPPVGTPPFGTHFACTSNINGKIARIVDSNIDDGVSNTGSVRIRLTAGAAVANAVAPAAIVDTTLYTVCMGF